MGYGHVYQYAHGMCTKRVAHAAAKAKEASSASMQTDKRREGVTDDAMGSKLDPSGSRAADPWVEVPSPVPQQSR